MLFISVTFCSEKTMAEMDSSYTIMKQLPFTADPTFPQTLNYNKLSDGFGDTTDLMSIQRFVGALSFALHALCSPFKPDCSFNLSRNDTIRVQAIIFVLADVAIDVVPPPYRILSPFGVRDKSDMRYLSITTDRRIYAIAFDWIYYQLLKHLKETPNRRIQVPTVVKMAYSSPENPFLHNYESPYRFYARLDQKLTLVPIQKLFNWVAAEDDGDDEELPPLLDCNADCLCNVRR
ncbi:hypothetical protein DL96DRAFT_1248388 [Flagelloscypha sp. PMI_526]|nr:hypothetical protein DL96DRAFT_1248388 [Flagelloscypha sp. PMI_526]